MSTLSFRKLVCVCAVAISIGLVLAVAGAGRVFADESLDQLLATAMENHPDIVAAKAKVALAEAELNAARLEVARQLIALWGDKNSQQAAVNQIEQQIKIDPNKRDALSKSLEDARVKSEMTETVLKYLTEKTKPTAAQSEEPKNESQAPAAEEIQIQYPAKSVIDKIAKKYFAQTVKFEFKDTPLEEVISFVSHYVDYPFFIDKKALSDAGQDPNGMPVTLEIKEALLPSALQAFQDQNPDLVFVIRDYGILLTTAEQAKAQGYYPAMDLAKDIKQEKGE